MKEAKWKGDSMELPVTATGILSSIVETHTMGIKGRPDPDTAAEGYWTKRFLLPPELAQSDLVLLPQVLSQKRIVYVGYGCCIGFTHKQRLKWWAREDSNLRPSDYESPA